MNRGLVVVEPSRTLAIIRNPASGGGGGGEKFARFQEFLGSWLHIDIFPTTGPGDGTRLARELSLRGYRGVVAAGGDGTVFEVINGLGNGVPLGICPLGTANVLAKNLGIPEDPIENAKYLINARRSTMDIGEANGRKFANMVGIGFDAWSCARVSPWLKRHWGQMAYILTGFHQFLSADFPLFTLAGDQSPAITTPFAIIANTPLYGGGLKVAPAAGIRDGALDVLAFRRFQTYVFFTRVIQMWLHSMPRGGTDFRRTRGREFTVTGPRSVLVQADGEVIGHLPLTVRVVERGLALLIP